MVHKNVQFFSKVVNLFIFTPICENFQWPFPADRWVVPGEPTAWPPRSPDFAPLKLFLWECMKDKAYQPILPTVVDDLSNKIRDNTVTVTPIP
jgi:hypothetical protein